MRGWDKGRGWYYVLFRPFCQSSTDTLAEFCAAGLALSGSMIETLHGKEGGMKGWASKALKKEFSVLLPIK